MSNRFEKQDLTDEQIVAYVDGELPMPDAEHLGAMIAADPSLAARAEAFRQVRDQSRMALSEDFDAPLPAALIRQIREAPLPSPAQAQEEKTPWVQQLVSVIPSFFFQRHVAAGAFLGIGIIVGIGTQVIVPPGAGLSGMIAETPSVIQEGTALASLLSETPSARLAPVSSEGDQFIAILTFEDTDGNWCREYEIVAVEGSGGAMAGVACRVDGNWRNEVLVHHAAGRLSGDVYLPVADEGAAALSTYIDERLSGLPLSAEEETAVIESGFRPR